MITKRKINLVSLLKGGGLLTLLLGLFSLVSPGRFDFQRPDASQRYDVRILRDSWGVPHVFGVTDADAAYGLAYAHAEDDFQTIQKHILAARGELAAALGPQATANDYLVALLQSRQNIAARYETDLSLETRLVCEGYAAGLNHFAALYPDAILYDMFPVAGEDIAAGFVNKIPSFFGLHKAVADLPQWKQVMSATGPERGSNAFAISPLRGENGQTFLAINSHQPWDGADAWYEAHVHSEAGWDMVGGVFPGIPMILQGHNRNLGWAFSVNHPDLVDVYQLEMNPDNEMQYRFDGQWYDLTAEVVRLKVGILGPFSKVVDRDVLRSVHGPALKTEHGTYAIRYSGMDEIRHAEQWFRMNKAQTFSEFYSAMAIQAIPNSNVVYADRTGNIFYLYNAKLPVRNSVYDWSRPVPGSTSGTLWHEFLPFAELPQVLNPRSGFVLNCNSSAFQVTAGPENAVQWSYPANFGIDADLNNRARRLLKLLSHDRSISEAEFHAYKYDMVYDPQSTMARYVARLLQMSPPADSLTREALQRLHSWDLSAGEDNTGAALAVLTFQPFLEQEIRHADDEMILEALVRAAMKLQSEYGRIDVPWHEVNRLRHGGLDLGLGGGPGLLHTINGRLLQDGRLKAYAGDSYILMVSWDAGGNVHSQSIHQYGSAPARPGSPHFSDQSILFSQRKLKPVWMDELDIRENLQKEYRPGEEMLRRQPEYLTLK